MRSNSRGRRARRDRSGSSHAAERRDGRFRHRSRSPSGSRSHALEPRVTRWPDFFIVGAPKCGTTALYEYLRQHPSLFLPFHKEPLFFGDDLTRRYGRLTTHEYLALFNEADEGQRIGEASAWYLYSESAAREIRVRIALGEHHRDGAPARGHDVCAAQPGCSSTDRRRSRTSARRSPQSPPAAVASVSLPGLLRPETLRYRETSRYADQCRRHSNVLHASASMSSCSMTSGDATSDTVRATFDLRGSGCPGRARSSERQQAGRSAVLQRLVYRPPGPLLDSHHGSADTLGAHRVRAWVVGEIPNGSTRAAGSSVAEPAHPRVRARDSEARGLLLDRSSPNLAIRQHMTVLIVQAAESVRNRGDAAIVRGLIATLRQLGAHHIAIAPRGWRADADEWLALGADSVAPPLLSIHDVPGWARTKRLLLLVHVVGRIALVAAARVAPPLADDSMSAQPRAPRGPRLRRRCVSGRHQAGRQSGPGLQHRLWPRLGSPDDCGPNDVSIHRLASSDSC